MRSDFAALILTHGRPDRVHTYYALRNAGYTGRIIIVIDNEDKTANEYRNRYGTDVVVFDKAAIAQTFDEGDNFQDRRAIIYARNASFQIAKDLGYRYFVQLDEIMTQFFFGSILKSNVKWFDFNSYKHGFIDPRALIPADYCELGQHKFMKNLQDYPKSCSDAIVDSLTHHTNKHCLFSALENYISSTHTTLTT